MLPSDIGSWNAGSWSFRSGACGANTARFILLLGLLDFLACNDGVGIEEVEPAEEMAFVSARDSGQAIYVMNVDGTAQRRLTLEFTYAYSLVWSPDGSNIVFDGVYGEAVGCPNIFVVHYDDSEVQQLTENQRCNEGPIWSPDGSTIAFASSREPELGWELIAMAPDGSSQRNITNSAGNDWPLGWSPDGTQILFSTDRDGDEEIYVTDLSGFSTLNLTQSPGSSEQTASWSPDGTQIAFSSDRDGGSDIYVMDPDGGRVANLTVNPTSWDDNPRWSPDGSKLAYWCHSEHLQLRHICVMNADGSGWLRVTDHPQVRGSPSWSADGSSIAFSSDHQGDFEVYVVASDRTGLLRLTSSPGMDRFPAWRPGG